MTVSVRNVTCKTILSKSGILSVDYSVNPYVGCEHGCVYCYARFMMRYRKAAEPREQWGAFVDVKANAPEVMRRQLLKISHDSGTVLFSSVTDPYQPTEARIGLTRKLLQLLSGSPFRVLVLTKSDLVLRDLDILAANSWQVGFTIVTADETSRKILEPNASPIEKRFQALETLTEAGIDTYVFIGPYIPLISDQSLDDLLLRLQDIGVRNITVDRLNLKGGNWETLSKALKGHLGTEDFARFRELVFNGGRYYSQVHNRIADWASLSGNSTRVEFCF